MNTVTFDKRCLKFILKTLDMKVAKDGIICDKNGIAVPSIHNQPVHKDRFAGVVKTIHGIRLICNDIISLIDLSDRLDKSGRYVDKP